MSEKSVIIDGVDVSECKHLKYDGIKKPICKSGGCTGVYNNCLCKENKECDYKQLQRARAENKELERKYADVLKLAKENADSNEYCLQELEQENERLKQENEQLAIRVANLNERFINGFYYNEHRYKQALQEIREIADNQKITADYTINKIIEKINEVIGAE